MKILEDSLLTEIVSKLESNTISAVAKEYGVHRQTVHRFLKKHGYDAVEIRTNKRITVFKELTAQGRTVEYIAKVLDIHVNSLYKIVSEHDIQRAPIRKLPDSDFKIIKELLCTLSLKEVADKWEVASGTLRTYLRTRKTSVNKIRSAYRKKIIKRELKRGKSLLEIADILGYVDVRSVEALIAKESPCGA